MCGIIGYINKNGLDKRTEMGNSLKAIQHRGPDYSSQWRTDDQKVFLGHVRLSIIDLDPRSNQPFHFEEFGLSLVFNGEIYNHTELKEQLRLQGYSFNTSSDTEVLIKGYHFWGKEVTKHLRGMFAFAIYDNYNKIVYCARDRAGEKPFFYFNQSGKFLFASELKALLPFNECSKEADLLALDYLLAYGTTPGNQSLVKGIKKLEAGNQLVYDIKKDEIKIEKYWSLPNFNPNLSLPDEELADELYRLGKMAVREQLEADVPVGVLLSGGVDSSLVTALAAESGKKIKTFNVGFPDNKEFDESEHANFVAKYFGTDHHYLPIQDIDAEHIMKLVHQMDDPIFDSSMIPTFLVTQLVKNHCTVALGGDGGDELFGGYKWYNAILNKSNNLRKLPSQTSLIFDKLKISNLAPVGKVFWLESLYKQSQSLPSASNFLSTKERNRIFPELSRLKVRAENIRYQQIEKCPEFIDRFTRFDFKNYMCNDILVKVDRSSMLNSLEMRSPLLDQRIIEFAFQNVPHNLKSDGINRKIILRKLADKILPTNFDSSRKQGFAIPINNILKQGVMKDSYYEANERFNFSKCKQTIEGEFGLTMLLSWFKKYEIEFPN
jgi:asparagine synthase (glutamine-hydrolysing)